MIWGIQLKKGDFMSKTKLTAKELYDFLKPNLVGKKGCITFSLCDLDVDIESTDIVGNSLQSLSLIHI